MTRKKTVKLTLIQSRAYQKLNSEWQSAYVLDEYTSTMDSLVKIGLAEARNIWLENPRMAKEYRKVGK